MKLKFLFLIIAALLFLFNGCNKDAFFDEETSVELKKAKVPIPLKGEVCMIDNPDDRIPVHFWNPEGDVVPGATVVGIAFLYGNLTHMGKLDEQSYMTGREGAYLDYDAYLQGKTIVVATYDSWLFAANGDYIQIVSNIKIDRGAQTITGNYTITGGSGKFVNAAGKGSFSGVLPCWNAEGTLEYPRD